MSDYEFTVRGDIEKRVATLETLGYKVGILAGVGQFYEYIESVESRGKFLSAMDDIQLPLFLAKDGFRLQVRTVGRNKIETGIIKKYPCADLLGSLDEEAIKYLNEKLTSCEKGSVSYDITCLDFLLDMKPEKSEDNKMPKKGFFKASLVHGDIHLLLFEHSFENAENMTYHCVQKQIFGEKHPVKHVIDIDCGHIIKTETVVLDYLMGSPVDHFKALQELLSCNF